MHAVCSTFVCPLHNIIWGCALVISKGPQVADLHSFQQEKFKQRERNCPNPAHGHLLHTPP